MNEISKKDWIQMQELLVSISKLLGEFRELDPFFPDLSKNIFKPTPYSPHSEPQKILRTVNLLSSLQKIQTEMSGWLEVLSEKPGKKNFENPPHPISSNEKPKVVQKISTPENQPIETKDLKPRKKDEKSELAPSTHIVKEPLRKAIFEVRTAIHTLSKSDNFQNPKPLPFKTAFQSVRPSLEQLIQTLETAIQPKSKLIQPVVQPEAHPKERKVEKDQIEKLQQTASMSRLIHKNSEAQMDKLHFTPFMKGEGVQNRTESPTTVLFAPMNGKLELSDIRSKKKKKQRHLWENDTEDDSDSFSFEDPLHK